MEKTIDPKMGQLTRIIRENKKLTLRDLTQGEFSISMISRFENGENSISIEKFFKILKNSHVYLDEFQNLFDNYGYLDEQNTFRKLAIAYSKNDIVTLKLIKNLWNEKFQLDKNNKFSKLNFIVSKIILASAQESTPLEEEIDFLMGFLEDVDDWGRYEFWIFGNCLRFFDDNSLKYYSKIMLSKATFFKTVHQNQQVVLRTFLNIIDTWLRKKNLGQALKYINHLKEYGIPIDFFYEKIILSYHEGHYRYLIGNKKGIEDMRNCAKAIKNFGFKAEAQLLFDEIESLSDF